MKFQSFSIVIGSLKCNARCPYCISKMTPTQCITHDVKNVNWRNFKKACNFARASGITTALITGKGEPVLFPERLSEYLQKIDEEFPVIELQTNGIKLDQSYHEYEKFLKQWYELGLTTIALSVVHYEDARNEEIFRAGKTDLKRLITRLHEIGYSIRLSCVLIKGYVDGIEEFQKMVGFAKENNVEQLSFRILCKSKHNGDNSYVKWVEDNSAPEADVQSIRDYLDQNAVKLRNLVHGAAVYDLDDQNVCITNALTIDCNSDEVRQLIFFPDGHLRYDWQYKGAILV